MKMTNTTFNNLVHRLISSSCKVEAISREVNGLGLHDTASNIEQAAKLLSDAEGELREWKASQEAQEAEEARKENEPVKLNYLPALEKMAEDRRRKVEAAKKYAEELMNQNKKSP